MESNMDIVAESLNSKPVADSDRKTAPIVGRHIPALDGIRGTAILLVLAYHLIQSVQYEFGFGLNNPLLNAAVFGWTGVDLFFVLSGFLITGILFDHKGSDHYFKHFYMRRALRIFPLYFGTLLVILLLRLLWPAGGTQIYGTESQSWMWVYMTNVVMAWKGAGAFGVLDHFWSLAIEEHFYMVWPFVVFVLNRQQLMRVAAVVIVVALVARTGLTLNGLNSLAIYILTPLRLDALCMGALLALVVRGPAGISRLIGPAKLVSLITGVAIVAIIVTRRTWHWDDPVMQTIGFSLLAVFFGSILILAVGSRLEQVFNVSILRWFGKYSYGMYVWHPIVFVLFFHTDVARGIRGGNGLVEMFASIGIAVAIVFALTLLSWNLWESQFLKLKRRFA
jgi:peptidoglycan/LPS O-acetylase OafA/YrhL